MMNFDPQNPEALPHDITHSPERLAEDRLARQKEKSLTRSLGILDTLRKKILSALRIHECKNDRNTLPMRPLIQVTHKVNGGLWMNYDNNIDVVVDEEKDIFLKRTFETFKKRYEQKKIELSEMDETELCLKLALEYSRMLMPENEMELAKTNAKLTNHNGKRNAVGLGPYIQSRCGNKIHRLLLCAYLIEKAIKAQLIGGHIRFLIRDAVSLRIPRDLSKKANVEVIDVKQLIYVNNEKIAYRIKGDMESDIKRELSEAELRQSHLKEDEMYKYLLELNPSIRFVEKLELNGFIFYFTNKFTYNDRETVFALVRDMSQGGRYKLRNFYKSLSCGTWRSSYGVTADYLKGHNHYTQETAALEPIAKILEGIESCGKRLNKNGAEIYMSYLKYIEDKMKKHDPLANPADQINLTVNMLQLGASTNVYKIKGLIDHDLLPCFEAKRSKTGDARPLIATMEYPQGCIPDFSKKPVRSYEMNHNIRGDYTVEVYESEVPLEKKNSFLTQLNAQKRVIEWHMAKDKKGIVWIEIMRLKGVSTNSYGVASEILDSGILTAKPIEYKTQAYGVEGTDWIELEDRGFRQYVDTSPLIQELLPVKLYKAAKGIV